MDIQKVELDAHVENFQAEQIEAIKLWAKDRELSAPVQLEIGSNRGRFLTGLARNYPEHSVVGIEIRRRFAETLQQELDLEGPTNAHILGADANIALPMIFADGSIHRVFVLFPDPWWKKRHAKRRLITPKFLNLLADKIAPDGHLVVKTDVEQYAQMVSDLVEGSRRWMRLNPDDTEWPRDEAQWPLTTRERKIIRKELPIWKIYAKPTGAPRDETLEDLPAERFEKPEKTIDHARGRRPKIRR
jgi:tRNA (guanine-N7-)-methyltransferase